MAQLGTFVELGGSSLIEVLANTDLDYIIIDTEHGHFDTESVTDMIRSTEKTNLLPYVRIGDTRKPYVLRMLDIGAKALIVPHIKTMEQINDLVRFGKFPPLGERGYCPTRTTVWGKEISDAKEYMKNSNEKTKLYPQCETKEALDIIEEIAATDGVDGIFVGPCDLSISLNIPLEFDNPILIDAIHRILKACKDNNKHSIIFAGDIKKAKYWKEEGFDSIAYSLDASIIMEAVNKKVSEIGK